MEPPTAPSTTSGGKVTSASDEEEEESEAEVGVGVGAGVGADDGTVEVLREVPVAAVVVRCLMSGARLCDGVSARRCKYGVSTDIAQTEPKEEREEEEEGQTGASQGNPKHGRGASNDARLSGGPGRQRIKPVSRKSTHSAGSSGGEEDEEANDGDDDEEEYDNDDTENRDNTDAGEEADEEAEGGYTENEEDTAGLAAGWWV